MKAKKYSEEQIIGAAAVLTADASPVPCHWTGAL
jgi:hypothetical protein